MKNIIDMTLEERKEYIRRKAVRKVMKKQEYILNIKRGKI